MSGTGRAKLVQLYGKGLSLDDAVEACSRRSSTSLVLEHQPRADRAFERADLRQQRA